ncbi:IS3 family transposase, partial [Janibacter hoylei]|uniref:IS3 family transposase n=1 Tax=Janibacter hoylei TaxID=364298 RepID=UPI0036738FB9
ELLGIGLCHGDILPPEVETSEVRCQLNSGQTRMESFFSLLQKNVLDTRRWDTREDLRLAIVTWIETKYNRRRRQRALGKLTPVEFEMIYATAEAA